LWYNKKIFEKYKLEAPKKIEDFPAVAMKLMANNITPLAMGDNAKWVDLHTYNSILLGTMGCNKYYGLWTGKTPWTDPLLVKSLMNYKVLLDFVNKDHNSLSWDQAAQLLIDKKAAMMIIGDWAGGYFELKNFEDVGWVTAPGTSDTFMFESESFAIPKKAKNKETALQFLKVAASEEGQNTFNSIKGSISALAKDDDEKDLYSGYNAYQIKSIQDWNKLNRTPSLAHVAGESGTWTTSLEDVVCNFTEKRDVMETIKTVLANSKGTHQTTNDFSEKK
jgi:glucose/mannose transport system substrate-binding protein